MLIISLITGLGPVKLPTRLASLIIRLKQETPKVPSLRSGCPTWTKVPPLYKQLKNCWKTLSVGIVLIIKSKESFTFSISFGSEEITT